MDLWVTTDKTNQIHVWDIPEESLANSIGLNYIRASIVDIIGIDVLKLVAVSCLDKTVSFWDLLKKEKRVNISLSNAGVHSLQYFDTFQVLVTAGYENSISLWSVNPIHFDYAKVGRLVGHSAMVTAIEVIEKTPMIISADDIGDIKVWDIRNLTCVQTLETGSRTSITRLISMYNIAKVCFVGSRVNMLEFEDAYEIKSKATRVELQRPVRIEYNSSMNEFVLCTNKEIRFIDITTGCVKKIYAGLLENNEDDITVFRLLQQNQKFILGDQRGNLNIYLYATGELFKQINSHTDEVSALKVDYLNRLIISSSWDSSIIIQKEVKDKFKVLRRVDNCFNRKEISLMEVSVYHNILITGSSRNSTLYIWDYEYMRLIANIDIEDGAEPVGLQIINGFAILIISTSIGTVHFFHFNRKDATHIAMRNIGLLDINKVFTSHNGFDQSNSNDPSPEDCQVANKMLLDVSYNLEDKTKPDVAYLYLGLSSGTVIKCDLQNLFTEQKITLVPHANARSNYNAERITSENFEEVKKNYKIHSFYLRGKADSNFSTFGFAARMVAKDVQQRTRAPAIRQEGPLSHPDKMKFKGEIRKNAVLTPRTREKAHPTPDTPSSSKFGQEILVSEADDAFSDLSGTEIKNFQAHKDSLTTLSFVNLPDKKLLTSSLDYYFRIWDLDFKLIASVNINHPLPVLWNLDTLTAKQARRRVMYGLKIIENILKRYGKKLSLIEERVIDLNPFLTQVEESIAEKIVEQVPSPSERPKLTLMRDEYDPRDIQYEKVKGIYQQELQGPSLKQMELEKRLKMAHKIWKVKKSTTENSVTQREETAPKKNIKLREYDSGDHFETNLMKYLLGNHNQNQNDTKSQRSAAQEETAGRTKRLAKKLEINTSSKKAYTLPSETINPNTKPQIINQLPKRKRLDTDADKNSYLVEPTRSSFDESSFEDGPTPQLVSYRKSTFVASQSAEESKLKPVLNYSMTQSSRAIPVRNKDLLATSRDETKITHQSSIKPGQVHNLKASNLLNGSDYYETRTDSKILLQDSLISRPTKKMIPSQTFLDYAGQKHLLFSGSQSSRTQTSRDEHQTPDHIRRKEQKFEFRQVLSSLERQLKKSQASDSSIHLETMASQTQKKIQASASEKLLPDIKTSKSKSTLSKALKGIETGSKGAPYLDFTQNLESFRKNMDQMIEEMKQAAQESVPEKIAKLIQEKIKIQEQTEMGLDYDEPHVDGRMQDFKTLDHVFKKAGAIGDDLKKPKTLVSLQSIDREAELMDEFKSGKKSIPRKNTRTIKNSREIESESNIQSTSKKDLEVQDRSTHLHPAE